MLKNMLEGEEGQQQLQNIVSMLGGSGDTSEDNEQERENAEMMMKIQKVMSVMRSSENGREAAFLNSLGPLLRPEKRDKLNKAVQLIGMGKAIQIFKDL